MNYPVPSFGVDHDVETTANSIAIGENQYNHKLIMGTEESKKQWENPAKKAPYNFNPKLDNDMIVSKNNMNNAETTLGSSMDVQIESDPICSSAGCTQYEHPKIDGHPMDYFVPNFGADRDTVMASNSAIAAAEKQLDHVWTPTEKPKGHDVDYKVPNFGVDEDIKAAQASISAAQDTLDHDWTPTQDENGFWTVPQPFDAKSYAYADSSVNVQLSAETESDPICSSAGCTQYEHPKIDSHPMDYPVPNFGVDHGILAAENSIAAAEKQLGRTWTPTLKPESDPVYYDDGSKKGIDSDITQSLNSMADQEAEKGAWNPVQNKDGDWIVPGAIDNRSYSYEGDALVQIGSDPICNSAGCTQYKHPEVTSHPMDYPVPSFGVDHDVETTANSIAIGEAQYNHKLIMGTEESKKQWENPAKKAPYNFNPALDHDMKVTANNLNNAEATLGTTMDVQTQSDPICSSAGCDQYKWPEAPKSHPVDYPVPNFGAVDSDIATGFNSLEQAEKINKHKWNFTFYDTPINPAKKTLYNFNMKLADDVIASKNSLNQAEEQLGAPMVIWDEPIAVVE